MPIPLSRPRRSAYGPAPPPRRSSYPDQTTPNLRMMRRVGTNAYDGTPDYLTIDPRYYRRNSWGQLRRWGEIAAECLRDIEAVEESLRPDPNLDDGASCETPA